MPDEMRWKRAGEEPAFLSLFAGVTSAARDRCVTQATNSEYRILTGNLSYQVLVFTEFGTDSLELYDGRFFLGKHPKAVDDLRPSGHGDKGPAERPDVRS